MATSFHKASRLHQEPRIANMLLTPAKWKEDWCPRESPHLPHHPSLEAQRHHNAEHTTLCHDINSTHGSFAERDTVFVTFRLAMLMSRSSVPNSQKWRPIRHASLIQNSRRYYTKRHVEINKESSRTEAPRSIFAESLSQQERCCL